MIICLLCRTLGSLFLLLKLLQDIDDLISLRPNASVNGLIDVNKSVVTFNCISTREHNIITMKYFLYDDSNIALKCMINGFCRLFCSEPHNHMNYQKSSPPDLFSSKDVFLDTLKFKTLMKVHYKILVLLLFKIP